jgi:hypothetical protein
LREARKVAGRRLIDDKEAAVFCCLVGIIAGVQVRITSVANTIRMEDVLERQNCYGDEYASGRFSEKPYWERSHYVGEYADIYKAMINDLSKHYGRVEARKRMDAIWERVEKWFWINEVVEGYMLGHTKPEELSDDAKNLISELREMDEEHKPFVHKEIVDRAWLEAIMMTVLDGNEEAVEKAAPKILAMTMLFQMSEDFANIYRDKRVGKTSTFTSKASASFGDRFRRLLEYGKKYADQVDGNPFVSGFMMVGLVVKSLAAYAQASKGDKELWRRKKLFDEADQFEENIENVIHWLKSANRDECGNEDTGFARNLWLG